MRSLLLASVISSCCISSVIANSELKSGWSGETIHASTEGCVQAILIPARRDFNAAAEKAGDSKARFPEVELRSSLEEMCSCITGRVAKTWTLEEFGNNPQYANLFSAEALSGGKCKPGGLFGQMLDKMRNRSKNR